MTTNSFSHSLNLVDLNDYLGPSQICIKPTQTQIPPEQPQQAISKTQIQLDHLPPPEEPITTLKKAEITLNDCLACSGCITSAESILVSLQSVDEVLSQIKKPNQFPILSISSHSLASFVAYNNLESLLTGFKVMRKYFSENLQFKLVLDLSFSQRLHLWESRQEFKKQRQTAKQKEGSSSISSSRSPLLASSCPGWICYAEKTQGQKGILEMISQVKSAQQIQGSIVKSERIANSLGVSIDQIYHVCVMSCYDKKLEASRSEFQNNAGLKDVDCVLTTHEVQDLMQTDGFDIHLAVQETQTEDLIENNPIESDMPIWIHHPEPKGSSSGGYLFNLLRASVPTEQDRLDRLKLTIDQKRGSDYVEFCLSLDHSNESQPDGAGAKQVETLFYGALFYGFKNLQNLIRKIASPATTTNLQSRTTGRRRKNQQQGLVKKDSTSHNPAERAFDFIEVMACPSGCLNGGGQIPIPKSSNLSNKQRISDMQEIYFQRPLAIDNQQEHINDHQVITENHPKEEEMSCTEHLKHIDRIEFEEDAFIVNWFKNWGIDDHDQHSPLRDHIFYTCYKAIEVESNGFAVQWLGPSVSIL